MVSAAITLPKRHSFPPMKRALTGVPTAYGGDPLNPPPCGEVGGGFGGATGGGFGDADGGGIGGAIGGGIGGGIGGLGADGGFGGAFGAEGGGTGGGCGVALFGGGA